VHVAFAHNLLGSPDCFVESLLGQMRVVFALGAVLLGAAVPAVLASGDDHGDETFEWGGIFSMETGINYWVAEKVDGAYVDPEMNIYFFPADAATKANLMAAEEAVEDLPFVNCTDVYSTNAGSSGNNAMILIPNATVCYNLHFDQSSFITTFPINVSSTALAIFAQHVPIEFENYVHYLQTKDGVSVEPVHETPEGDNGAEGEKKWGMVFLACLIINLVTLSGVAIFGLKIKYSETLSKLNVVLHAFAAGALLSTAAFLMAPESLVYWQSKYPEEAEFSWRFGVCLLSGFIFPVIASLIPIPDILIPRDIIASSVETASQSKESAVVEQQGVELTAATVKDSPKMEQETVEMAEVINRTVSAVLTGDFLHNMVDGFLVAVAFQYCSGSFAWGISGSVIAHEIAQELSDYIVLTSDPINLKPAAALGLNFLSGTSVILGGLIGTGVDIGNDAFGTLLGIGSGVYMYVATAVAMNFAIKESTGIKGALAVLLGFAVGAIAIGLVLLNHEHCDAESGGGGHSHSH